MLLATVLALLVKVARATQGRRFQGRIVDFPTGLIMKITPPKGAVMKADIIQFIQPHTSIPTPHVVASADGYGRRYLLMKKIPGQNLEAVWTKLEPAQRTRIAEQLPRSFIAQLRSLQFPHGRAICSLNGAAIRDSRITAKYWCSRPFSRRRGVQRQTSAYYDERVTLPTGVRSRLHGEHDIVFTHGDNIALRNTMVDGDTIVALLDWEQAGWYPEHWEWVKAMWSPPEPEPEPAGALWLEAVKNMFGKN